jgi:bacteriocin biosynthesis cyclodehydratase domain-containing protein
MTRRPVLAPGLHVTERAPGELQIGLTPAHRLLLVDTPSVRRTLTVLERGEAPRSDPTTRKVLAQLAPVLRDGDSLIRPGIPETEVAAVALRHPRTATSRLRDRGRARISVQGDLGIDPGPLFGLTGLGIDHDATSEVTAALLLCRGDLDRDHLDGYLRDRTPHLLVRAIESEIVLGPFVVPGLTACLRCLDLHLPNDDPRHPSQTTRRPGPRNDGVPDPINAAVLTMALGWAVSDLIAYAEGDRPSTWSSTVRLTAGASGFETVRQLRHPQCGCSWIELSAGWSDAAEPSVTMER